MGPGPGGALLAGGAGPGHRGPARGRERVVALRDRRPVVLRRRFLVPAGDSLDLGVPPLPSFSLEVLEEGVLLCLPPNLPQGPDALPVAQSLTI